MQKHHIRYALLLIGTLYLLASASWLRAASYSLMASPCNDEILMKAKNRVTALLGPDISDPLMACTNEKGGWLGVEYGRASFALGLPPAISIGPEGHNIDVVAHEWVHAELFNRVGLIRREFSIPTWFDEGLAMQVDHRSNYNDNALTEYRRDKRIAKPNRKTLSTSEFFTTGVQGTYHYALSRCLVEQWLRSDAQGTHKLDALTQGDFTAIYDTGIGTCS